jgi:hypothetical protein
MGPNQEQACHLLHPETAKEMVPKGSGLVQLSPAAKADPGFDD